MHFKDVPQGHIVIESNEIEEVKEYINLGWLVNICWDMCGNLMENKIGVEGKIYSKQSWDKTLYANLFNSSTRQMDEGMHPNPFPKKGDLGLAKNYWGITLTSIAAKIYNALLRNCIESKIDNILRKNQNGFRRNRSTTSQILTIRRILEGVRAKKHTSDITICRLYQGLRFHSQRKDGTNPTSIQPT